MKTILLLSLLSTCSPSNVFSQTKEAVTQYITDLGYTISEHKYANISEGESCTYVRHFYEGVDYIIVGFSENVGVEDIDIYLVESGLNLKSDASSSSFAVVEYSIGYSRDLTVKMKNYASSSSTSDYRCDFIIGYR